MYCFLGFRSSTANGFGHDFLDQKFQNNLIKIRIAKTIWDSTKTDSAIVSSNFDRNLKTDFLTCAEPPMFTFYFALIRCSMCIRLAVLKRQKIRQQVIVA